MTGPLEHMPLALAMANERAERWKQRYDAMRAEVARLTELLEARDG